MHYKICPHCKEEPDERGFCGCEPPFSLDAIPREVIDGIARTMYPRIVAYFKDPVNQAIYEKWLPEYERKQALKKAALAVN